MCLSTGDVDDLNQLTSFFLAVLKLQRFVCLFVFFISSEKLLSLVSVLVETMTVTDKNMIQFHLEVLYGVSVKILEKKKERSLMSATKIFGVPLGNSPRCYVAEFGLVPCFLVDACSFLLERAGTVGLFRKPGSLPRIKILRDKLNGGEGCLSTALPYDVATLIKQFCRELPEPLFPSELHASLLEAQGLPRLQDRTEALQLLSCLVPARSASCLHYLFDFLSKVSQRYCKENLMTSSNLATIFAPCLLGTVSKVKSSDLRLTFIYQRLCWKCTILEM
uniref:Rho-GAP domain-containing protein n=1 Tax=Gouania willdenowi TaxID=441366 RepID=A0A8C5DK28_GOUWI